MVSTASPTFSCPIPSKRYKHVRTRRMLVVASDSSGEPTSTKRKPVADTRIHWSSPDEGWIVGESKPKAEAEKNEPLGERFSDLINKTTSHYQSDFLEYQQRRTSKRSAYRRLSKEYHPDTTSLPLDTASDKFMQLREAYNVLSNLDPRAGERAERMGMKLEDLRNWESIPDTVDRLGGKNMKLSDQAMTASTIDAAIIIFSICCIIYVVIFQEPY